MLIAISLAVSAALNLIGMLANYLYFRSAARLLLAAVIFGILALIKKPAHK